MLPPTDVLSNLRLMAGEHLNTEAVEAFVSMVEMYPVGVHVRFGGGKYVGCYGVVLECRATAPNRPLVRLGSRSASRPAQSGPPWSGQ